MYKPWIAHPIPRPFGTRLAPSLRLGVARLRRAWRGGLRPPRLPGACVAGALPPACGGANGMGGGDAMGGAMRSVTVRVQERQKRSLQSMAAAFGLTPSAYGRLVVGMAERGLVPDRVLGVAVRAAAGVGGCRSQFRFALPGFLHDYVKSEAERWGVSQGVLLRAILSIPCVPGEGSDAVQVIEVGALAREIRGLRTDLSRIGNNVNQIAHAMNVLRLKQWVSGPEVEVILNRYATALERADDGLDAANDVLLDCLSILSSAGTDIVPVGGVGCR